MPQTRREDAPQDHSNNTLHGHFHIFLHGGGGPHLALSRHLPSSSRDNLNPSVALAGPFFSSPHSGRGDGDKDPLEDIDKWGESVDKVLSSKAGQIAFVEFLKSEYSEENILFWLACEEYKNIKNSPEMISSANRIYTEFVQTEAPRQINIDCTTRENITKNISQPTLTSFDSAQKLIYSLMARDCYPRFLKSDVYQGLLMRKEPS
ncbi:regulator of G-protein signaling 21 isoform X2 [Gadus macrocephalus]|uniref:regulator of G-protein signaling 21 isoform X2 n=1 Tax=Gadus macrocephalus TaxID=80720 RepID=UPI0028CB7671|nr:regulator of G-protein signaling 21 isoform X2 [Gadus macrocephalus]